VQDQLFELLRELNITRLFFCFDESQADLDATVQFVGRQTSFFEAVLGMIDFSDSSYHNARAVVRHGQPFTSVAITNIISSTSLSSRRLKRSC
jgi:hypothetical protein